MNALCIEFVTPSYLFSELVLLQRDLKWIEVEI